MARGRGLFQPHAAKEKLPDANEVSKTPLESAIEVTKVSESEKQPKEKNSELASHPKFAKFKQGEK